MVYNHDRHGRKDGHGRWNPKNERSSRGQGARVNAFHYPGRVRSREYFKQRRKYIRSRFLRRGQHPKIFSRTNNTFKRDRQGKRDICQNYYSENYSYERSENRIPSPTYIWPSMKLMDTCTSQKGKLFEYDSSYSRSSAHYFPSPSPENDENFSEDGIEITGDYEVLSEIQSDEDFDDADANSQSDEKEITAATDSNMDHSHTSATQNEQLVDPHNEKIDLDESNETEVNNRDYNMPEYIPVIDETSTSMSTNERQILHRFPTQRALKPVPSYWNPYKCSKEENDTFIAVTINCLMKNGGSMRLDTIRKTLQDHENTVIEFETDLKGILERYTDNFDFEDVNATIVVHCKTKLKLCPLFSAPYPKACNESCNALHVCAFHLLSKCDMGCDFHRHYIYPSRHNTQVLRYHLLQKLKFNSLRLLMRNTQNCHGIIFPSVCSHYNVEHGCRYMTNCLFVHICKYIMHEDGCKFGEKCKRSHSFFDEHNQEVLRKYGFVEDVDEDMIKHGINSTSNVLFSPSAKLTKICRLEYKREAVTTRKLTNEEKSMENNVAVNRNPDSEKDANPTANKEENGDKNSTCTHVSWAVMDQSTNRLLSANQTDADYLEKKYQEFCRARWCMIPIDGTWYTVDMVTMQGKKDNSNESESFVLKRSIKENPDFIPLE